ncbi:MAG: glycosyltransferase family 4 protein [Candidatus Nanopelagicales bacterium]
MRIALVHSFYASAVPSGENTVVRDQGRLLVDAGHEVLLVSRHSDDARPWQPVTAALTVATGRGPDPSAELRRFAPDIVHVHNLFPNFGTRWLARWPGPLVATMHNYRPMCANALFLRDGHNCTLCPDHGVVHAVRHRCYRGSAAATIPLAVRNRRGLAGDAVVRRADRLIVLSARAEQLYLKYGADPDRLRLLPNGLLGDARADRDPRSRTASGDGWVAVGRMTPEKGLAELLEWWPADQRLTIFGDGPQRDELLALAGPRVTVGSQLPSDQMRARFGHYEGSVHPGTAWEGGVPMVLVESLARGTPVVARAGGAAAEVVSRHGCGVVYDSPAGLVAALTEIRARETEFRAAALVTFHSHFGAARWLSRLEQLYDEAISARGGAAGRPSGG